jgi:hypothetical protein
MMITLFRPFTNLIRRDQTMVKSFDHELRTAGALASRADAGMHTIATDQIVGSVGRSRELRSDFTFRRGPSLTDRHRSIARAMRAGKTLPPLELYALTVQATGPTPADRREYFVVDGHHRVAMARRLGQDYLDAHVVEYRVLSAEC